MYYHTPNHQLNIHFPPTRNPFPFSAQANANDILGNLGIPEAEEEIPTMMRTMRRLAFLTAMIPSHLEVNPEFM